MAKTMTGYDRTMPLGDHLEELRWRLIRVLLTVGVVTALGLAFQPQLKLLIELPLRWALDIAGDEVARKLGLSTDREVSILKLFSLIEGPINGFKLAIFAGVTVAFPVLVQQLWGFVAPALTARERRAGLLLVPVAVASFYLGILLGYFFGLPWLYAMLLEWNAREAAIMDLRQSYYYDMFFLLTIGFGLMMDIPWLVVVLVRSGIVTTEQLIAHRKILLLVFAIGAAIVTPPDPFSQIMVISCTLILFELGLLLARLQRRRPAAPTAGLPDPRPPRSAAPPAAARAAEPSPPDDDGPVAQRKPWQEDSRAD